MEFANKIACLKKQQGFTLLEIVIVIMIISLLATLAVPSFNNFYSSQQLENTAKEILSDLRLAKQKAISQESEFRVIINGYSNDPANTYYLRDFFNRKTIKKVKLPSGIEILKSDIIYFYPNGSSQNNTITIRNKGKKYLYLKIYRTGRMRITDVPTSE